MLGLLAATIPAASAHPAKLYPTDEGPKDPSFKAFRDRLRDAIRDRDHLFIEGILHHDVEYSLAEHPGVDGFRKFWRMDRPDSRLWEVLGTVLSMGGGFVHYREGTEFCAPYVFARWPRGVDMFSFAAITGKGVKVRAAPDPRSRVLTTLAYDLVRVEGSVRGEPDTLYEKWIKIILPGGRVGFVEGHHVWFTTGYRACFKKFDGGWRLTGLVAGA